MVVQFIVFLTLSTLICRGTDISKCFTESLGIRDNGSRVYMEIDKFMKYKKPHCSLCHICKFKCENKHQKNACLAQPDKTLSEVKLTVKISFRVNVRMDVSTRTNKRLETCTPVTHTNTCARISTTYYDQDVQSDCRCEA